MEDIKFLPAKEAFILSKNNAPLTRKEIFESTANAISRSKYSITFVDRILNDSLFDELINEGYTVYRIPARSAFLIIISWPNV